MLFYNGKRFYFPEQSRLGNYGDLFNDDIKVSVKSMSIEVGFGVVRITPPLGLPLPTLSPNRLGQQCADELYVKAIAIRQRNRNIAIISIDCLYVSRAFTCQLRNRIFEKFSIPRNSCFVAATHTHSSPYLIQLGGGEPSPNEEFFKQALDCAEYSVQAALSDLHESTASIGKDEAPLSINRRAKRVDLEKLRQGCIRWKIANRPNPKGPVDNTIYSLKFSAIDHKRPDIYLVVIGCHPAINRSESYSADFPGRIEAQFNQLVDRPARLMFLQGFSGDTRPNLINTMPFALWPPREILEGAFDRYRFRKDSRGSDLEIVASQVASALKKTQSRPISEFSLSSEERETMIPYDASPPNEKDEGERLRLNALFLSKKICILGIEAEVFSEYAHWIRNALSSEGIMVLPVGCVGGIVGYIPTAAALRAGGYETDRSLPIFGLKRRFSGQVEQVMKHAIRDIVISAS